MTSYERLHDGTKDWSVTAAKRNFSVVLGVGTMKILYQRLIKQVMWQPLHQA